MAARVAADGESPIDDVVISFGNDESSSSGKIVDAGKFGPHKYEPLGVVYTKVDATNVYYRTYDRMHIDGSMVWRLKTVKVGTMQNGDFGGARNLISHHAHFERDYCQSHPKSQTLNTAVMRVPDGRASRTA